MSREINRERYRTPVTIFDNLSDFLNTKVLPPGILTILHNNVPIDILYHPSPGSNRALFLFHGAIEPKFTLPVFQGGGITSTLKAHRIFIADPTLQISGDDSFDKGLTLGWHAGNYRQFDLQTVVSTIIARFNEKLNIEAPIFYGISGGGFASLHYGSRSPNSTIVTINPQTSIARYIGWAVERWTSIGFGIAPGTVDPTSVLPSEIGTEVISTFSTARDCRILYMQNSDDHFHIDNHMDPFMQGAHPGTRISLIKDYWGPRHSQPSKELMAEVLSRAVEQGEGVELSQLGFEPIY